MPPDNLPNGVATSQDVSFVAPDIYKASTVSEIRAALKALHERDTTVTNQLQALLDSQADLSREIGRLDLLRAHLGTQVVSVRSISHGMLDHAASTAQSLSSQVKTLDLEKSRVEETLNVVDQVSDLKACIQGLVGSMGAPQDWETAASYLHRTAKIPASILHSPFAARVIPSVEIPDAPAVTIENAKESLCGLFLREFEKAAKEGDGARVTRFFKLFPLIGRGSVGLDVYGRYVCQGVSGSARANLKAVAGAGGMQRDGLFYAGALTKLFEHIAQIVESHGGLVERHYGQGMMGKVVERLQAEADVQGGIVLDTWLEEREVERRLTDVKSYPFSFLVQSFMPHQRGTPRTGSPAVGDGVKPSSEDERVDMKEVDGILNEAAVMLGRWSLYLKFLAGKCRDPNEEESPTISLPDFLAKSGLHRKVSNRLITPYNIMSTFFFRRSVEKAFQLDELPAGLSLNPSKPLDGNPPYIISAVDDVMYIVNTVIQRSISTQSRDVISSVIPTVARVLGSDFIGMLQRKMRDESYPKPVASGGFPPEDKIIAFIVLINSLDVSNEYIGRIVSSRVSSSTSQINGSSTSSETHHHQSSPPNALADLFPCDHDADFVASTLLSLQTSFSQKSTELLTDGLTVLFNQVLKARLRPLLSDLFRDVDYTLSDSELADLARETLDSSPDDPQFMDFVTQRFEIGWEGLMAPVRRLMTEKTYATVLETTARYLARWLEKRIWALAEAGVGPRAGAGARRINELGAVRMERDFSGIVGVVGRTRGAKYGLREEFARVVQVLMVANLEGEEWEEVSKEDEGEEDGMRWVLSKEERERARGIVAR